MESNLRKFKISPRVLKADSLQTVNVKGLDLSCEFFDDTEYKITIIAVDDYCYLDTGNRGAWDRDILKQIVTTPKNGEISFSFLATGEHLWHVIVSRVECEKHKFMHREKYWPVFNRRLLDGIVSFDLYSVKEDLFNKKPFKGDLHLHTFGSDGYDGAPLTSATYRKYGFDFISITDHYDMSPSIDAINALHGLNTNFTVFTGEEVHCSDVYHESFHVVNFNPQKKR